MVAPVQPASLQADASIGTVSLTWPLLGDDTVTRWQVRQRPSGGSWDSWADIPESGAGTTTHLVTDLNNGTTYGFQIRAVNPDGFGAESDEVEATPKAGATGPNARTTERQSPRGITIPRVPQAELQRFTEQVGLQLGGGPARATPPEPTPVSET